MRHLNTLLKPLIALAAAGLIASLVVHLCALLGILNPFGEYAWALHGGIFVIWLPAIIATIMRFRKFTFEREDSSKTDWEVVLDGSPKWMKTTVKGFFIYAFINFGFFMYRIIGKEHASIDRSVELQGFSGHWMLFYSFGMALLYSAMKHIVSKCANGHSASPGAKNCDQCGSPVTTTSDEAAS